MLCRVCGVSKIESEFYGTYTVRSKYNTGRSWTCRNAICKTCARADALSRHYRNRDANLARSKRWYAANKDRGAYSAIKAAAKRRGATMFCTFEEWADLLQRKACAWCGCRLHPSFRQVDHVVPLCEGGQHVIDNLVLSCANCNVRREWERKEKKQCLRVS